MNQEQFLKFINAMMMTESDEEMFPNGDTDDYEEDIMEENYHELGE